MDWPDAVRSLLSMFTEMVKRLNGIRLRRRECLALGVEGCENPLLWR